MVKVQAGDAEELLTDVLDLDAVTRVREFGTAAVSRMWKQIDSGAASAIELPMYEGGRIRPRPA
jgi:formamidase